MTKALKFFAALLFAVPLLAQAQRLYSQPELDQMLAPVALYPDPLLSQVLMAATYPEEVREAAAWSRANPGLQGDDAVRAVHYEDWDPSVKSLVAFPQILQRMAENPAWTQSLGDAFLAQEPHVMDTVQQLRRRAQAAGNLQSNEQMRVQQQGQTIVLQPASSQYVYVPYYDPYVVYGPWWWPAYRPVYWAPWHGYARAYRPGVSVGFWWGAPVSLPLNFFFGNFDWHHRHARVVYPNAYYYRSAALANRTLAVAPQRWQNDPQRRAAFAGRPAVQARQQVQLQNQVQNRVERQEQQVGRREARQAARVQVQPAATVQVQPAATVQVQPAATVRAQPAAAVQVQPAATVRAQPQTPAVVQQRSERREERQAARVQTPAAPQIRMPAASAPQTPRAERQEQRQEQRQERREQRQEQRGQKG